MRKLFYFLLAVVAIVLAACKDKNGPTPPPEDVFDIQITMVQSTKVAFTITPIPNTKYDYWVVEQRYLTDDSSNPRTLQEAFEAQWASGGFTYDSYLSFAITGSKTASWKGMDPNSDNYVIAYQCSEDNKLTILASKQVHTLYAGELHGEFSVGGGKKVHFSQGNLQHWWTPGGIGGSYWKFAETQYQIKGKDENEKISSNSLAATIDLFGWGTGSDEDNLWKTYTNDIAAYSTYHEWGDNPIKNGGDEANLWRTLTVEEWVYLLCDRNNAANLFGIGSVDGVYGIILLPDNWTTPTDVSFTTTGTTCDSDQYEDREKDHKTDNTYTSEQWEKMEDNGAVFLPAAGYRSGTTASGFGEYGNYWSSSRYGDTQAKELYFCIWSGGFWIHSALDTTRDWGFSVRLVRDKE